MRDYMDMSIDDIKNLDKKTSIIIFGAGDRGRNYCSKLMEQGYEVIAFWDNDTIKQGKEVNGVKVISYEELSILSGYHLLLGSAYAMQEKDRIDKLDCIEVIRFIAEDYVKAWLDVETAETIQKYLEQSEKIKEMLIDDKSRNICENLYQFIAQKDNKYLQNIASEEEHYLISEVKKAMPHNSVIVDAGAFMGEFPSALLNEHIEFGKCYSFEANGSTCAILAENMRKKCLSDKVTCVDKGLAEKSGTMYFEGTGATTKLVEYATENKLEVVSIDEYFDSIPIDFIKMDIEGMELPALRGGLSAIQKDRPILAISIYHSFSDRIDIPLFLKSNLENYVFLMRQHSIWFAETVLYAIPKENYKGVEE